jgi:flagellar hook-associated protein 2
VSPTDQRLVLTSDATGTAGAFTAADVDGGTVLQSLGLAGAPAVAALDAKFTIDNVPFTRSSNTVGDAIAGVTLTLSAAELGRTASVKVDRQPASAKAAATAFVDAYNKVVAFVKEQSKQGAPLASDAGLRAARAGLAQTVLGTMAAGPDEMKTLSAIGISISRDGTLSVNSATLEAAYNTRSTDLRALLAERGGALVTMLDAQVSIGTGVIDRRKTAIDTRVGKMSGRIVDIDSRLEKRRTALLAQFARSEASIGMFKNIQASLSAQIKSLTPRSN